MTIRSLQHVQVNLPLSREEATMTFYRDVLGLELMGRPESLSDAGRSSQHPALITEGLVALRERLLNAGYEVEEAIPIEGRERFFTRDPGGNRIEFLAFES